MEQLFCCSQRFLGHLFFVFTGLFSCICSYAQIPERIFFDTLISTGDDGIVQKGIAEGKYIYLAGGSYAPRTINPDHGAYFPTITKLDTSGTVIWTAYTTDRYEDFQSPFLGFFNASCSNLMKSGNRLYATVIFKHYFYQDGYDELWSISEATGAVIWRKRLRDRIIKAVDYNSTELLLLTDSSNNGSTYIAKYWVLNKSTGAVVFNRRFSEVSYQTSNYRDLFVDNNNNVLISYIDSCWKYRDNRLNQLLWTATEFNAATARNNMLITQAGNRYLFIGRNFVKAVDTTNGSRLWLKPVPVFAVSGVPDPQGEDDGYPSSIALKDTSCYITWKIPYSGSLPHRGFTLTRINSLTGNIGFNVAYDFQGIPPDSWSYLNDPGDFPLQLSMDSAYNIYLAGVYDNNGNSPGNWGIMKINGQNGSKIYEATITQDSTRRMNLSSPGFLYYLNGKMFTAGNLEIKTRDTTKPCIISFDTLSIYKERYRKFIGTTYRYPSSLIAVSKFSATKMLLLKKVGRSAVLEMRTSNDDPVWSKTFSIQSKFIEPQNMIVTKDKKIAFSAISYLQSTSQPIYKASIDSLLFFKVDSSGNTLFSHRIQTTSFDTIRAIQAYNDNNNVTNFFFIKKCASCTNGRFLYSGYTLDSNRTALSEIGSSSFTSVSKPDAVLNPIQQIRNDTMGTFFGIGTGFSPFMIRTLSKQTASGYTAYLPKRLPKVSFITSSIKVDSLSFIITGTDSIANSIVVYYRYLNSDSLLWATQLGLGVVYNADTSASSVFTLSQKANLALSVARINKNTGAIHWQKDFTAPAGAVYFPVNIQYNSYKSRITVTGFITDTTKALPDSRYFYITFDTSGNTIRNLEKSGDLQGDTRISDIDVLQNGLTIIGGSITTELYGKAGFYNSTDTAASIITGIRPVTGVDDFSAIVFPNPAKNEVSVQFTVSGFSKKLSFLLFNTEGKLVSTYSLKNIPIGIHIQRFLLNFQPGVYFLKLDDGDSRVSVKPILILR